MLELLDSPATPVADALVRLEEAVSSLVGIVRVASAIMVAADEARLHAFACQLASAAMTTGAVTVEYAGSAHVDVEPCSRGLDRRGDRALLGHATSPTG